MQVGVLHPKTTMTLDEWRALRRQAKVTNRDEEPDVLAPPVPGHDPSAIRACSSTVDSRINSSCCGWVTRPTGAEFYDAIHAEMPTKRQRALIRMGTKEARPDEIVLAWAEEVYTVRELVAAIHRARADHPQVARELNPLARR